MKASYLFIAALLISGSAPMVCSQTLEAKLASKIEAFDSESKATPVQLIEVAQRFQIPMGIEWADEFGDEAPSVHAQNTTVSDLISRILAWQPGSAFRLDDGVVHVFANTLVDDPGNFLNIRLKEFSLKQANMGAARFYLWGAIISHLHPRGGFGGGWGGYSRYRDFDLPKITLTCQDVQVRQALTKIVLTQGNALWVVRIRQHQMMDEEPFYVQIPGPLATGERAKSFDWQFVALDVHRTE